MKHKQEQWWRTHRVAKLLLLFLSDHFQPPTKKLFYLGEGGGGIAHVRKLCQKTGNRQNTRFHLYSKQIRIQIIPNESTGLGATVKIFMLPCACPMKTYTGTPVCAACYATYATILLHTTYGKTSRDQNQDRKSRSLSLEPATHVTSKRGKQAFYY